MSDTPKPLWMSDPLVSDIHKEKLDFLQSIVFESKGKTKNELLPFFISVIKKGKAGDISFTDDEMNLIISAIKKNSTPDELAQIDKFAAMYKTGNLFGKKNL